MSNLYFPRSVIISSALYLFCSWVVALSAFTIVASSIARWVPMASKPPLNMSHAVECWVSALFECTPKSSYSIRGTRLCRPFFVSHRQGLPCSIFPSRLGRLKTMDSRTLSQSLYTMCAICSARLVLPFLGGACITIQRYPSSHIVLCIVCRSFEDILGVLLVGGSDVWFFVV